MGVKITFQQFWVEHVGMYFQRGDDDSWEVRRLKTLEIEVQGCSHSFSFKTSEGNSTRLWVPLRVEWKLSQAVFKLHSILNITESWFSVRRARGRSVTFKTWVRFPSAPPKDHMQKIGIVIVVSLLLWCAIIYAVVYFGIIWFFVGAAIEFDYKWEY